MLERDRLSRSDTRPSKQHRDHERTRSVRARSPSTTAGVGRQGEFCRRSPRSLRPPGTRAKCVLMRATSMEPLTTQTAVPPLARAAGWRMWVASVAMMLCSWLSYVDRQILAVLSPLILRDTGLTAQSYGEVVSAFSIAYMIANPLWGSILDYVGLRIGMLAAVAIWTVASTAHSWVAGF